jgi:hypothetical protein
MINYLIFDHLSVDENDSVDLWLTLPKNKKQAWANIW